MRKTNVIIPLGGIGKRFKKAGYEVFKPFIEIDDKYMIDYVLEPFPINLKKYIITVKDFLDVKQIKYLEEKNCEILYIEQHTKGPAYSIYQAKEMLPLDESFFIAYTDIYWTWNWSDVEKELERDGIVFTHSEFHPHLIENNYSAFCLADKSNNSILKEIKEKSSFTDNWMNEPLSIGTFYIKNGYSMIESIGLLIENKLKVSNEYFPSLMYNYLLQKKDEIYLMDVNFFIHWGIPEQLEDFLHWKTVIESSNAISKNVSIPEISKNVVTMAGLGNRMLGIDTKPKALIPIHGKPMYQFVTEKFKCDDVIIITTQKIAESLNRNDSLFILKDQTSSQYETIMKSSRVFEGLNNFLLTSCDAYGIFDQNKLSDFIKKNRPDAIIFSFTPTLTQKKLGIHHTHITVDGNKVTNVHIKSKSSESDLGLAGFFWVRDGNSIINVNIDDFELDNELCADHIFKELVKLHKNVLHFKLDNYIHIGTSNEFKEFMYWDSKRKHLDKK